MTGVDFLIFIVGFLTVTMGGLLLLLITVLVAATFIFLLVTF